MDDSGLIVGMAARASMSDAYVRRWVEGIRVVIVAGISAGVVLVGGGSRLAMLVLRLTSPDHVRGVVSDDGFTIGEVTLAGTYNLLLIGSAVGIIGACAYRMVAPSLIGPIWFRRVTTGLGSGVVVGSMLIHSDGIDFTALQPTWLAIGLFIALPALFGALIGSVVDTVARQGSWTASGRRRWVLPIVAVACFPLTLIPIVVAVVIVGVGSVAPEFDLVRRLRSAPTYVMTARAMWLLIALVGLVALRNDIAALT